MEIANRLSTYPVDEPDVEDEVVPVDEPDELVVVVGVAGAV